MTKELSPVVRRFLSYAAVDTRSKEEVDAIPSTKRQFDLARLLEREMKAMGLEDVKLDEEHCYVYGYVPATAENMPTLGFIAHMDTVDDFPSGEAKTRIVENYRGGSIPLNDTTVIDLDESPFLANMVGEDIIVTDGTTVLGADDKAGIAEILTMAEMLLKDTSIPHGKIAIGFTPDEEVGNGPEKFDVAGFGAQFAYTVDGGALGEIEYENFNACSAKLVATGKPIHPGSAKGVMINALHIIEEFDAMLPPFMRPEHTEGREGFFHLTSINGDSAFAKASYIVREHDFAKFEEMKALMEAAAQYINKRYGKTVLELTLKDGYRNMIEKIKPHMFLIDNAVAAMESLGVAPEIRPIRGGTDGARLSFMGLPCPNLCTGGWNFHSNKELISVQALEKCTLLLLEIVKKTYAKH